MRKNDYNADCKEFVSIIQLVLDGEATEEQKAMLFEECESCKDRAQQFSIEKALHELIRSKIDKAPLPCELPDQIRARIKAFTLA